MEYEVGQKVKIKSLDWYNRHTNGTEVDCGGVPFTSDMKKFCSRVMTISCVHADCYTMVEDLENYYTDEMIEGLVEEENNHLTETVVDVVKESNDRYRIVTDPRFDIEVDEGEYYAVRRKKEYPKTYEECCKVLGIEGDSLLINTKHITDYERDLGNLMGQLHRLIICRDAYWKIAGEEMGLGKPWEPDFSSHEEKFSISVFDSRVVCIVNQYDNIILTFPTREMRDAFYDNFAPDIQFCEEFL